MAARRKNGSVEEAVDIAPGLEHWRGTVDEKLKNIAASVFDLKQDVKDSISAVKQSVESMGERLVGALKEQDRCGKQEHQDFDKRISDLETAKNRFGAKVAVVAAVAGTIGGGISSAAFSTLFHKLFG